MAWFPYQKQYGITFTETVNAAAALRMLAAGRVDGADIELNVAQHLMQKHQIEALVLAKQLPFTPTGFYLSTLRESKLLAEITTVINRHSDELKQLKASLNIVEHLD